jgi:hypothetical protein
MDNLPCYMFVVVSKKEEYCVMCMFVETFELIG